MNITGKTWSLSISYPTDGPLGLGCFSRSIHRNNQMYIRTNLIPFWGLYEETWLGFGFPQLPMWSLKLWWIIDISVSHGRVIVDEESTLTKDKE